MKASCNLCLSMALNIANMCILPDRELIEQDGRTVKRAK
jgi:hypothetical protein